MTPPVTTLRGYRNHNPGNLRHGSDWHGLAKEQPDTDFCSFLSPEFGIRAMARTLRTYNARYALNSIRTIINRWAPPCENKTESYIQSVASYTGFPADVAFPMGIDPVLPELVKSIIHHELGCQPYSHDLIDRALHWEKDGVPISALRCFS